MSNNNTSEVIIQVAKNSNLAEDRVVKLTRQGEAYAEIVCRDRVTKQGIKKISKDEYIEIKTGEVKKFNRKTDKNGDNLKKTFARLRSLIRTNFDSRSHNQLFITLTYAENMTDSERLYKDFDKFSKKLKYKYSEHKFDYVCVAEPQGRGAWHMHVMLKTDRPVLFVDNRDIEKIWGHGWTDTQRLKSNDVGSYYVAYFTDLLETDKKGNKARKKGARLSMYPIGFKLYRTSRGIVQPTIDNVEYSEVLKEYGKPIYEKTYEVVIDDEIVNRIYKKTHKRMNC